MSRLDFAAVANAALSVAERLLALWLPGGKRVGHEWQCGSLAGNEGSSCNVSLINGRWADFATDDRGNDLISLYAAIHKLRQGEAARAVAAELGMAFDAPATSRPAPAQRGSGKPADEPKREAAWADAGAWPGEPEPPRAHEFRGIPGASWDYHDASGALIGRVCRFETSSGGKEILPLVWSRNTKSSTVGWRWRQFDEPRPLFNWPRLASADPTWRVLVVEGEKCAELAQQVLGDGWIVITWPGGCKAWAKANWALLAGRQVVIWPDADAKLDKAGTVLLDEAKQPGMRAAEGIAAELAKHGCTVKVVAIPRPGLQPDGWDVADLITESGANAPAQVRAWLDPARLRDPRAELPPTAHQAARAAARTPDGAARADAEDLLAWRKAMMARRGEYLNNITNIGLILRHDERWAGVVAFDEFENRIMKVAPPPFDFAAVGEWSSDDDSRTVDWIAQRYGINTSSAVVAEAVEMVARERPRHVLRDWLNSLQWDGTPRLDSVLEDFCGVPRTPYTTRVLRYFCMGMVKRVLEPGCKFDFCLTLEGPQGIGKSTFLRVLGGAYYSDTELDLAHKDSMSALRGKWLHEFSEMDSITKAEAPKQKSFLSRQVDEFRPVYARREVKLPRQVCFAGTTNEIEWARDSTGARRFWPVEIEDFIDTDGLAAVRDQLFAEAVALVRQGFAYYPSPEEQRTIFGPEQARRVVQEPLVDALHDWALEPTADEIMARSSNGGLFSVSDACLRGLSLTAAQITRDMATRVGKALAQLGCVRVEKRNGMTRYWYKAPQKKEARASARHEVHSNHGVGDDLTPF